MKKIFKNILKILIILLITYIMVNNNLKSHSVYYARNMPNTKKEIEMMVLIDNLDSIYTPELEGYRYDFDGYNNILKINNRYPYNDIQFYNANVYNYVSNDNISFRFDKDFLLYYVIDRKNTDNKIDIKTIDEEAIKQEIYDFVKPIIDVQPEPKINLQWIFNLVYIDYR